MTDAVRICRLYRVRGRVQGVFFRASTREQARQLALTGWVRNCEDGDVELTACGTPAQLDALERWLWQGPPSAQVTDLVRRDVPAEQLAGFEIRY